MHVLNTNPKRGISNDVVMRINCYLLISACVGLSMSFSLFFYAIVDLYVRRRFSASSRRLEEDSWRYEHQSKKTGRGIWNHVHNEEGVPAHLHHSTVLNETGKHTYQP